MNRRVAVGVADKLPQKAEGRHRSHSVEKHLALQVVAFVLNDSRVETARLDS